MLGRQLRKAREKAGLTQEELSFACGIGRAYISQLENDKKSPTVDTLIRICRACNVKPSQVLAAMEAEVAKAGRRAKP